MRSKSTIFLKKLFLFLLIVILIIPVATEALAVAEIWQIQGATHSSYFNNENVITLNNIVTTVGKNGFYMQTPTNLFPNRDDNDDATSNGIFVFTQDPPTVKPGDLVNVAGTIIELRGGATSDGNLPVTTLTRPTRVDVVSHDNALPLPIVLGNGGRVPPGSIIDDDAEGNVETSGTFNAVGSGIDFYESLEGMRVQINDALAVSPTNSFKEIWVVGDNGTHATTLTPNGGVIVSADDFNPERIQLDDELYVLNSDNPNWQQVNVGAHFTDPLIGVVSYGFTNYEVLVTNTIAVTASTLNPEISSLTGSATQLTIATYNLENLGGNAQGARFTAHAQRIVNSLRSPDIIVLEEVQDNNGARDDAVVAADTTFTKIIAAITAAGGPTYDFKQISPENNADGGEPGGNIRIGFLFNPMRVTFVDRAGGNAVTPATIECNVGNPVLNISPGRILAPTTGDLIHAFDNSRKPLIGEFTFNGQTLYIIGVHLNSKGGDDALFGFSQPPIPRTEAKRELQVRVIKSFVDDLLNCDAQAKAIVMGDINDFNFSVPVTMLAGTTLHNLVDLLPVNERYSYLFEGNSQLLDQILVSDGLRMDAELDIVHINAEFFDQVSDHDPSVALLTP